MNVPETKSGEPGNMYLVTRVNRTEVVYEDVWSAGLQ